MPYRNAPESDTIRTMDDQPVAVVMSTFNEEKYVDRCIDAILAQTVPARLFVVDGGSTDGTVERLRRRAIEDARIRVFAYGARCSLPTALNFGIGLCDEPFVAKIDARTFIAPDFLERALEVFESVGDGVVCVGGRPEQYGETYFGEGLARARTSRFGVGDSGYADSRRRADVDTVQCGVYRRDALAAAGGFDPALQFGEDEELNWRLRATGKRIVLDTGIRFRYLTRSSWLAAFRQYRNYGRARARVIEKHPDFLRLRHLAPSTAVVVGTLAASMIPASLGARVIACSLALAYCGAALYAARMAAQEDRRLMLHTAAAFTALHFGYGIGLLEGIFARIKRSFA